MINKRHGLSRKDAEALSARILNVASADHARVNVDSGWRGYSRVATNRITWAGGSDDVTVTITSAYGKRVASVTTNRLDDAGLAEAVKRSQALAKIAPENPEYLPELGPQEYMNVSGYYASTGNLTTEERGRACAMAIEAAEQAGYVAAGYIDAQAGSEAVATSNGLFAHHPRTGAAYTLTVRTPGGSSSGWAGDEAADWQNIESTRIAADAVRKCRDWRSKTALEPGAYTVVLEPTAVGMLMLRMGGAFNARPADEGRSYFGKPGGGNRVGEKLFAESVTIRSDPAATDAETAPFTNQGLAIPATTWIENGVVKNLAYSRAWAQEQDREPLPEPSNFLMSGAAASVEDMIASTDRGVLITRFWYIRGLNPRTIAYTGLTRDGTFLIENGKISRPVTNFRFNQSLAELLQNVEMLGTPTRVAAGENSSVGTPVVVPAMKVRNFHLSSVSDAI